MRKQEAGLLIRETSRVFQVLASPICLRIYLLLAARSPLTVAEIESAMIVPEVSRRSITKALARMSRRRNLTQLQYRSGPGRFVPAQNRIVEVSGPRTARRYSVSPEGARLLELVLRHSGRPRA